LDVTKNVMSADCACADGAASKAAASARPEIVTDLSMRIILSSSCVLSLAPDFNPAQARLFRFPMRDVPKKKAQCKKHDALVFHVVCDQLVCRIADNSQPPPNAMSINCFPGQ
jgi:hypothetical protein